MIVGVSSLDQQVAEQTLGILRLAQDERRGSEILDDFPFMLRVSKHSEPFFSNLLN